MGKQKWDFSGWATRNDLHCSDGRTIRKDAFKDCDGKIVPIFWNHQHDSVDNVLGHGMLENRDEGVYFYGAFNEDEEGQKAKKRVQHGDIRSLSIMANQLRQVGGDVIHGVIREVSLVPAGANPGAFIDIVMSHGEEVGDAMILGYDEAISLHFYHADDEEEKKDEKESDDEKDSEETLEDVINSMTEKQRNTMFGLIGKALEEKDEKLEEGDPDMKKNIFDRTNDQNTSGVLMHSDGTLVTVDEVTTIFKDAKRLGSLRDAVLEHGIDQIDYLFPDDRTLTTQPTFIQRDMGWVSDIMGSVHHTPFARVKSVFADITEDDARAKGYIKGKMKKEEFFSLIKRRTEPTTVYKKQKMDRDDMIDITDFDVAAWLKTEMRMMLNEELARAYLIGDGRLASSDDHINDQNIRPVAFDDDLFTIHADIEVSSSATDDEKAKALIRGVIKNRKLYRGSGNPVMYTTEDALTDMLLLEDTLGHALYADEAALARKMRVRKIVTVPVMEGVTGKNGNPLVAVVVNMGDYNVGADRGGAVNMFDDFDIDYNQQKYLIETRCSGALTVPYSAMAFEMKKLRAEERSNLS